MSPVKNGRWLSAIFMWLMVSVLLLLTASVGVAESEPKTDTSGQWLYVVEKGSVMITGCVVEPTGHLSIPSELDGHAVTSINDYAFANCESLISASIPNSVMSVGANPFYRSPLVYIDVPTNHPVLEGIDGVLFDKERKMLVSYPIAREGAYTIPEGVLHIGIGAFTNCSGLTDITIPDSVMSIGDRAFGRCDSLSSVTISNSVIDIGANPFYCIPSIKIILSADHPKYILVDGVLFDKQQRTLISFPLDRGGAYSIPEGVLHIGDNAFYACDSLTNVFIPNGVMSIGGSAFGLCRGLTSMTVPNSVTSIGGWAFQSCYGLTNMAIPSNMASINQGMFNACSNLASVSIPSSVTSIDGYAFANCDVLSDVFVSDNVTFIGDDTFSNSNKVILCIKAGSYAEQYAKVNDMNYLFINDVPWQSN